MSSILRIRFPKDFEERYERYTASFNAVDTEPVDGTSPAARNTNLTKRVSVKKTEVVQKPKTGASVKKKFPYKVPSGTIWENFTIQFLSDEKVFIQAMGKKAEVDYKAMDFEDKRSGRPDSQWKFLLLLAKLNGEIRRKDLESEDKLKKHKERLAARLRDYFSIEYDPFYPYTSKKSYRIKIVLVPPLRDEESAQTLSEETEEMFADLMGNSA